MLGVLSRELFPWGLLSKVLFLWAMNQYSIELQLAAPGLLRSPIDLFFEKIVVNDDDPAIRLNRLGLLAMIREKMLAVADFTKIEG